MKKSEVVKIAATLAAGAFANPSLGLKVCESWSRQNLFQEIIQETINVFYNAGIPITEDEL
jgi:hypothetical protein